MVLVWEVEMLLVCETQRAWVIFFTVHVHSFFVNFSCFSEVRTAQYMPHKYVYLFIRYLRRYPSYMRTCHFPVSIFHQKQCFPLFDSHIIGVSLRNKLARVYVDSGTNFIVNVCGSASHRVMYRHVLVTPKCSYARECEHTNLSKSTYPLSTSTRVRIYIVLLILNCHFSAHARA